MNCRSNHLHIVVTADRSPKQVRVQFKAWCTRHLKKLEMQGQAGRAGRTRENWWAERGSDRYVNDPESLDAAIVYVRDGQD